MLQTTIHILLKVKFLPPLYVQMYYLDPNEIIEEYLAHPLNYGISRNIMHLLEKTLRDTSNYADGYTKMCKVEDRANQLAASPKQQPLNV